MKRVLMSVVVLAIIVLLIPTHSIGCKRAAPMPPPTLEFTYANPFPPTFVPFGVIPEEFFKRVYERTDERIKFGIVHGGALLKGPEVLDGVSKGIADAGGVYPGYTPGKCPIWGAFGNIVDLGSPSELDLRGTAVVQRKLLSEFPEFAHELDPYGVKILLGLPIDPYFIMTKTPVRTLADLEGKKISCFGKYLPMLVKAAGAIPIAMPGSEVPVALATGVIDGTYSTGNTHWAARHQEGAPHILIPGTKRAPPMPIYTNCLVMNVDSWNKIPSDLQKVIEDVADEMWSRGGEIMEAAYERSIKAMLQEGGGEIHYLTQEDVDKWIKACPDFWALTAKDINEAGLPGTAIVARYKELARAYAEGRLKP